MGTSLVNLALELGLSPVGYVIWSLIGMRLLIRVLRDALELRNAWYQRFHVPKDEQGKSVTTLAHALTDRLPRRRR